MSRPTPAPTLAALLAALALGLPVASGVGAAPVEAIEFEVATADLEGTAAGDYWADLEADLSEALSERLSGRMADTGANLRIRIDSVALTNAYDMLETSGSLFLDGRITVIGPTMADSHQLRVSSTDQEALDDTSEGADSAIYEALVEAFADGVLERLE